MFENANLKTELMIVCDKKNMQYANYLMGLIGQNDDVDGTTVGTKDGFVTAAIYMPKHYVDTLPKITSNTHILFIGTFKEAKEQMKNVDMKLSKFGMHYGWIGKRAVMYVDDVMLKIDEYEKFINFSKGYQREFEKATVNLLPNAAKWVSLFLAVVNPITVYELISAGKAHKTIKDQQYRCLIMILYLDNLQKFLEG